MDILFCGQKRDTATFSYKQDDQPWKVNCHIKTFLKNTYTEDKKSSG